MEELKEEKIIRDKVFKKALDESIIKYDIVCRTLAKRDINRIILLIVY